MENYKANELEEQKVRQYLDIISKVYNLDTDEEFKVAVVKSIFAYQKIYDKKVNSDMKVKARLFYFDASYFVEYCMDSGYATVDNFNYWYKAREFKDYDKEILQKVINILDEDSKKSAGISETYNFKQYRLYEDAKSILEENIDTYYPESLYDEILKCLDEYNDKLNEFKEEKMLNRYFKNKTVDFDIDKINFKKYKFLTSFDKENLYINHFFYVHNIEDKKDIYGYVVIKEKVGSILNLIGKKVEEKIYNKEEILDSIMGGN